MAPVVLCVKLQAVSEFRAQDVVENRDIFRDVGGRSINAKCSRLFDAMELLWTKLDLRADKGVIRVTISTVVCPCSTNVIKVFPS